MENDYKKKIPNQRFPFEIISKGKALGMRLKNPQVLKFAIYFISGKPIAEKAGKR